jgi:hypothetical protein
LLGLGGEPRHEHEHHSAEPEEVLQTKRADWREVLLKRLRPEEEPEHLPHEREEESDAQTAIGGSSGRPPGKPKRRRIRLAPYTFPEDNWRDKPFTVPDDDLRDR